MLYSCTKVQPFGENFNSGWQDQGVEIVWEKNLGNISAGFELQQIERNICIANRDGQIYLINSTTGETTSQINSDISLRGGGACTDERYIGITDSIEAVGLELQSGAPSWRAQLPGFVIAAPQSVNNTVLLFFADGTVVAYANISGDELWRITLPTNEFRFASRFKTIVDGNTIYFGQPEGSLYAVDVIDGFVRWQTRLFDTRSPDVTSNLSAISGPTKIGDTVCASAFGGKLGCFSSVNGDLLWIDSFSSGGTLTNNSAAIFLIDDAGGLNALSVADGTRLWHTDAVSAQRSPLLLTQTEVVVVEDGFSGISLYDADTGNRVGGIRLNGSITDMRSVANLVVVLTSAGRLYGLRLNA